MLQATPVLQMLSVCASLLWESWLLFVYLPYRLVSLNMLAALCLLFFFLSWTLCPWQDPISHANLAATTRLWTLYIFVVPGTGTHDAPGSLFCSEIAYQRLLPAT